MTVAPPAPLNRREMIAERCRRSVAWRIIHTLGSLKLALLLLATIALACAIATFYESRFDAKVAQTYIYKAPWFLLWLGVLCVNLFAVTLTRWPWERKHLGFIITHYGIITLLIGAVIGSQFGFEGNVLLRKDQPPTDRLVTSRSVVQIQNLATEAFEVFPFDAAAIRPSEKRPRTFPIPDSTWQLVIDDSAPHLTPDDRLVPSADPAAPAGLALRFSSGMMAQDLTLPLLAGDPASRERDFFGLARLRLLDALPTRLPLKLTESHLILARYAPIVQGEPGATTGVTATLSPDGRTLEVTPPDGRPTALALPATLGRPQTLGGNTTVTPLEFWPDFTLVNGQPATASQSPNNPAVLLRVESPRLPAPGQDRQPTLEIALDGDRLAYQLLRGPHLVSRGTAAPGEPIRLGWADWIATPTAILPHAGIEPNLQPATPAQGGPPGFRAHLRGPDGQTTPPRWIASGDRADLRSPGPDIRLSYGLESRRVDFTLALTDFNVPRFEGTDTPADFIASVRFHDPATGRTRDDTARMNTPASWPGGWLAVTTGLNYKFSQAQWNPENLDETTLQVLFDPGWLLKWTGSLAICAGIFIMFYLRPKKS